MELFKTSLSNCLKMQMSFADKIDLLKKIIQYCKGINDDIVVFDMELTEDVAKAAVFYGGQTISRMERRGVRYFIGGDEYYDNPENETEHRNHAIQYITEITIDYLLVTWLNILKDAIIGEVKLGIWEGCIDNPMRLAVNLNDIFGHYIHFDKALGLRKYKIEISKSIEVYAVDSADAVNKASSDFHNGRLDKIPTDIRVIK